MEDLDLEMEMEEYEEGDEQQNRTFILLVAVMGGLLLIGIVVFCVWVVFFAGRALGGQIAAAPTDTPAEVVTSPDLTATAQTVTPGTTPLPPTPTATSRPAPSPTPRRTPTPAVVAQVSPTAGVQGRTAIPTATRTLGTGETPAQTGLGAFTAVVVAAGLLILLIMARRLRTAH